MKLCVTVCESAWVCVCKKEWESDKLYTRIERLTLNGIELSFMKLKGDGRNPTRLLHLHSPNGAHLMHATFKCFINLYTLYEPHRHFFLFTSAFWHYVTTCSIILAFFARLICFWILPEGFTIIFKLNNQALKPLRHHQGSLLMPFGIWWHQYISEMSLEHLA